MCKISEGGQVIQFQAAELQQRAEKLVCWNTKSLLIEHRACHDVPPLPEWGMRDPQARGKPQDPPPSYTPDSQSFTGALA
jgi:hypothetical protein